MPKRQRMPRYGIVAAEEETAKNSRGHGVNNVGNKQNSTGSRQRSSPGSARPAATSTPMSIEPSAPINHASKTRKKIRGRHQQQVNSPSPPHQKQSQPPKRQHQHRQLPADKILFQLLKACENHRNNCHPDYHPQNDIQSSCIPPSCESAITTLRMLIPKLECTIVPTNDAANSIGTTSTIDTSNHANDIIQLCRFYDNVIRGTYCPHLPHLFGFGTDPQIILGKVLYLLRSSLTVELDLSGFQSNIEDHDKAKGENTASTEYLNVVSRTISGLLASVIDDSSDHIRRKLFVDWIVFLEDLAVLSMTRQPSIGEQENSEYPPVRLALFEESSLVIQRRSEEKLQRKENHCEEQTRNSSRRNYEGFSLDLHRLEQVRILQEIALGVLDFLTSNESTLARIEMSPEQQGEEPSILSGGDMDLFFPSGIVTDIYLVSSILASLKPMILMSCRDTFDGNDPRPCGSQVHATAVELLLRICLDWHRLGSTVIAVPLLPCITDAAVLTATAVLRTLSDHIQMKKGFQGKSKNGTSEKHLAFLLDQMVCRPPGCEPLQFGNVHSYAKIIHAAVLTILLDCLDGIVSRLHRRLQIKVHDNQKQSCTVDDINTSTSSSKPTSSTVLDLAVLEAIHFIVATTPSLALTASDYCTSRGIFPNFFLLASLTTMPAFQNKLDWHDNKLLLQAANRSLVVLIHALSSKDAKSAYLLDDVCLGKVKYNSGISKSVTLEQSDGVGREEIEATSSEREIDKQVEENTKIALMCDGSMHGSYNGYSDDMLDNIRNLKRKQSNNDLSTKRRKTSPEVNDCIAYFPVMWYDALDSFFGHVFEAGKNLRDSFAMASSQRGTCDKHLVGRIIEDIRCLSGGLHFTLSLLRKLSMTAGNGKRYILLSGISRVAHELSVQLKYGYDLFMNTININASFESLFGYAMADAILGCGLLMYFLKLESKKEVGDSFPKYIIHFLDSVSSFSGRLIGLGPQYQCDLPACGDDSADFSEFIVGTKYFKHFGFQCFAHCTDGLSNCPQHAKEWLFDQSLATLNSLSIFARAALVTCLRPVHHNTLSKSSNKNSESEYPSLDLFSTFFQRYTEFGRRESSEVYSSENVASLLHLLPLMILSLLDEQTRNGLGKDDHVDDSDEFPSISNLLPFLKSGISPLIQSLKSEDTVIFQSLVFTLGHINALATDTSIKISTRDPASVLNFMAIKHLRLYPSKNKKSEFFTIFRGMILNLVKRGSINDENPISRYFLWMSSAWYCINASPSEVRQQTMPKVPRKNTSDTNGSQENILSRDVLLPWLVDAPFSDPDNILRKFISLELSSLMMSREYNFLVSRFTSNEDFKEYLVYSRTGIKDRSQDDMYSFNQLSGDVIDGLFEEIDGILSNGCGIKNSQPSLPLGRAIRGEDELSNYYQYDYHLRMQQTAARTLASVCFNAGLNHPFGKTLFEKSALRLVRMWAAGSKKVGGNLSFPEPQSASIGRISAFGRLTCLSRSLNLSSCLMGEISWTYFPSATFSDVVVLNSGKARREQYELLERMVRSFFTFSQDSLQKKNSIYEASKVVNESIPSAIAQLVSENDEDTIQLIVGFNIFLKEKCENYKVVSQSEVHLIGISEPFENKEYIALSMGTVELKKRTKDICLETIDKLLPLVLTHSDQEDALPLKFFTTLTAPATLAGMMAGREQLILKGIAWELGRDHYRVGPAIRALKTAALACEIDASSDYRQEKDASPGTNAAKTWVTKNFMYLIVNMQLNWGSRKTVQQVQALRCLNLLLDFLHSSDAPQYFPQVLSTVNAAITTDSATRPRDPDVNCLRLNAIQCLSKFIRLSAEDNMESVVDNLTMVVVTLLPILEEDVIEEDRSVYQEAQIEAISLLEFLTRSEFVRAFPKAFSQIPFLPTSTSLGNVHKSLRDNGINFDNLVILSTVTSESQAGSSSRREGLTYENTSNSTSSVSSSSGDHVLALQNRISLVSSLLDNENTSVRKVALQHLVDLLRANRNLFHILVENEGGSSVKNFLTLVYEDIQNGRNSLKQGNSMATNVTISNIIEKLMQRCVHETDWRVRLQLATCLGEIGAIGEHKLDDISLHRSKCSGSESMYEWRLDQPPWQSRAAKYELQLVTKYLVAALKAAPSQEEQLKIAFTIQQLLLLLDDSVIGDNSSIEPTNDQPNMQKREMSKWLLDKLVEANIFEVVEPFWLSEFKLKDERFRKKQPPFFNASKTYHLWISEFCRWMILKTKDCSLSRWKDFFFACQIAVRSSAGLETAEFLLPLLVLDRVCFGSVEDFESICQEFLQILDFDSDSALMDTNERQKAVRGFFSMIETLEYWAEIEAEQRYRSKHRSHSKRSSRANSRQNSKEDNSLSNWPADDTITQIGELISRIPMIDQAKAATKVGMHAKGLRLLELLARKNVVEEFFESSSGEKTVEVPMGGNLLQQSLLRNANIELMKIMLSNLNDCETLNVIGEASYLANPLLQVADSIQWKEASGNYEGALLDYERALQVKRVVNPCSVSGIEKGSLDCMLKLGRFESVLSRVLTRDRQVHEISTKSFAVEAALHLGQWDKLSNLVEENENNFVNLSPDDAYRQATGKAILCVRDHDWMSMKDSFRTARNAVMDNLSSVAQESYSKAYTDIAKLQCIRELEDAAALFSASDNEDVYSLNELVESSLHEGWAWEGRLKLTAPRAASTVLNMRVAIARIGNDPVQEGSILLDIGKQAFKNGMPSVAENFYSQAEATLSLISVGKNGYDQKLDSLLDDVRVQYAKLKKGSGENLLALKILGQGMVQDALIEMNHNNGDSEFLKKVALKYELSRAEQAFGKFMSVDSDKKLVDRFANRLLRLTQWTVEGGMQSGNEIMERFQTVIRLSPEWEKGHFHFAKYLNDLVARFLEKDSVHGVEEDLVRFRTLYRDKACHQYTLLAIEHYATTLKLDMKHVYQALPRLLSLWFDFVSVQPPESADYAPTGALKPEYLDFLAENQNKANLLMADNTKAIPAAAYYTAMPQLISRVIHDNEDTAKVVKRILERVLTKFPPQAMWRLAWLKGSKNSERSKIGGDIFKGAQRVLIKNRQTHVANLLKASDSLFKFLQDLARYNPKVKPQSERSNIMSVKSWKGIADLSEFIPPVQAALSISPFKPVNSSSKDYFPRVIPRMRAFSSKVTVMNSKAKPKKIKAFAVPGTWKHANVTESKNGDGRNSTSTPLDCDIGEIHFLVKQEAKGDLRKDARVQDLNNVINRLMTSSNNSNSTLSSKSRRLRVRTFAVTCLSEDTGILEWVPDTDSLRNLVSRSYNPQTSAFCSRRRGSRMTNFGDASMRSNYDRAQNQFIKNGDIAQAAKLYYTLCLKQSPPVLSWWFVQRFRLATDWYEARKKFTLTAAAWSSIGHVIGLGDRHSENILVETTTGRIIHVDFDCIFDKGLNLPRPEVVPFRLTPNMLDAFGPTGADGMFSSGMESSLQILRENRDTLLSVLEPFIKDPVIDWKRHRTQQNVPPTIGISNDSHGEAKRSIHVIKERLSGICNLRNPNYRKLRNVIPRDIRARVEEENMMKEILPLSVGGQVQKLCTEASKNENLVQLYVGWMPWI